MHTATILGRSINTEFIDEGTLFYGKTNWRKHQADYDGLIGPGSLYSDQLPIFALPVVELDR